MSGKRSNSVSSEYLPLPRSMSTPRKSSSAGSLHHFEQAILPCATFQVQTNPFLVHYMEKPLPPPPLYVDRRNKKQKPHQPRLSNKKGSDSSVRSLRRSSSTPSLPSRSKDAFAHPATERRSHPNLHRSLIGLSNKEEKRHSLQARIYTSTNQINEKTEGNAMEHITNFNEGHTQQSWLTLESRNNSVDQTAASDCLNKKSGQYAPKCETINCVKEIQSYRSSRFTNSSPATPTERTHFSGAESCDGNKGIPYDSVHLLANTPPLTPSVKALRLLGVQGSNDNDQLNGERGHSRHRSDYSSRGNSSPRSPHFRRTRDECDLTPLPNPARSDSSESLYQYRRGQDTRSCELFVEDYHDILWDQVLDDRLNEKAKSKARESLKIGSQVSDQAHGCADSMSVRMYKSSCMNSPPILANLRPPMMWLDEDSDDARCERVSKRDKISQFLSEAFSQRLSGHHRTRSLTSDSGEKKHSPSRLLEILPSSRGFQRRKDTRDSCAGSDAHVSLSLPDESFIASAQSRVKKSQISTPLLRILPPLPPPRPPSSHPAGREIAVAVAVGAASAAAASVNGHSRAFSSSWPSSPVPRTSGSNDASIATAHLNSLPYPPQQSPFPSLVSRPGCSFPSSPSFTSSPSRRPGTAGATAMTTRLAGRSNNPSEVGDDYVVGSFDDDDDDDGADDGSDSDADPFITKRRARER